MREKTENAVFNLDSSAKDVLEPRTDEPTNIHAVKVYTIYGKHDKIDDWNKPVLNNFLDMQNETFVYAEDRPEACAKIKFTDRGEIYEVKLSSLDGRMYNPDGLYSEEKAARFNKERGKPVFFFRRVSKTVFDLYLMFLETKKVMYLTSAEREI